MKKFRIKETVYKNGINEFTVQVKSTYWYGNDFKSDTLENSIRVLISPFLIGFIGLEDCFMKMIKPITPLVWLILEFLLLKKNIRL